MRRFQLWVSYILFFLKELWVSNIRVAQDVLRKHPRIKPALIAVPLDLKDDFGLLVLANSITLTPGTLSVDISKDKKFIYIHTMYLDGTREEFCRALKESFEARVRGLVE